MPDAGQEALKEMEEKDAAAIQSAMQEISLDPFLTANISANTLEGIREIDMEDPNYKDCLFKPIIVARDEKICGLYTIGKKLGAGGFGEVFLDKNNDQNVIKTEFATRPKE